MCASCKHLYYWPGYILGIENPALAGRMLVDQPQLLTLADPNGDARAVVDGAAQVAVASYCLLH